MSSASPASGAVVMGTGIVSLALASDDRHVLSLALFGIAATVWVLLGMALTWRAARDWPSVRTEAGSPAALTSVAGTAVLGARASGLGWGGVAAALLLIATIVWLGLLPYVLGRLSARSAGAAFMATVSTQGLSVLSAQLAVRAHAAWLLDAALALLVLGLALYLLVLARFDFRQLLTGRGDHWVSGGALAITTLAAARIALGARELHALTGTAAALHTLTLALWSLSSVWLVALIGAELVRPRLRYHVARWATVFPVGMYAACSFDAGWAAGAGGLTDFARVWVWLGFALWLLVFVATLGSGAIAVRFGVGGVGVRLRSGSRSPGTVPRRRPTSRL